MHIRERGQPISLTGEWNSSKAERFTHYLNQPYFQGSSNELALKAVERFKLSPAASERAYKGVLFIHGEAGVGKTHLVLQTANFFHKNKHRTYYNTVTDFLDDLKTIFNTTKKNVRQSFDQYDCICIDELQNLNTQSGGFVSSFFDILDLCYSEGKILVLSSEFPLSAFGNMPQRTISRIRSGFVVQITLPDPMVKRQYIEYFWQKQSGPLPEEAIQIIMDRCEQIREILSIVNILQLKDSMDTETIIDTINSVRMKTQKTEDGGFKILKQHLMDYYGLLDLSGEKDRRINKVKSILYYLFHEKISPAELRKELNVDSKRHKRLLEAAPKNIEEITSVELLKHIRKTRPIQAGGRK